MKPEQITAWALDEASAEDRQHLEAALLENPTAKQTAEETKEFCDFLLTELRDDSLALTDAQRERLVEQASRLPETETPPPKSSPSSRKTPNWRTPVLVRLAMAACVTLGGLWTWQAYSVKRNSPQVAVVEEEGFKVDLPKAFDTKRSSEVGVAEGNVTGLKSKADYKKLVAEAQKLQKIASDPNTPPDQRNKYAAELNERVKDIRSMESEMQEMTEAVPNIRLVEARPMMKLADPLSGLVAGKDMGSAPALPASQPEMPRMLTSNAGQTTMTAGDVVELKKLQDQAAYGLNFDMSRTGSAPSAGQLGDVTRLGRPSLGTDDVAFQVVPSAMAGSSPLVLTGGVAGAAGVTKSGAGTLNINGANTYTGGTTMSGGMILGAPAPAPAAGPTFGTVGAIVSTGVTVAEPVRDEFRYFEPDAKPVDAASRPGGSASSLTAITPPPPVLGKLFEQQNGVNLMTAPTVTTKTGTAATMVVTREYLYPVEQADGATLDLNGNTATLGVATTPASPPVVMNPQPDSYYFTYNEGRESEERMKRDQMVEGEKMRGFRPQLDARSNTESYTRIIENELKDVAWEPLSTFSIDVDTAAYANVRRFLNQNTIPPADAVRIEELVNYFPTAEEGPVHDAKEPFAVRVEMAPCPWQPVHRLARIAIKGRELGNDRKNSNLVFLVDVSGSMNEPNKLPLVQQSLRMLTEQLGEGDRVTMVVYAGSSGLVLPPTNGEKKADILAAIDKLKAGGSTHGSAGIQLAYEQGVAGFIKEGVNRVILCTDGDFNVGVSSPEALETLITRQAKSGVFLSVLGFGSGNLKDRTMETLADKGNGNYAYIDSLSEARKVLVEQMSGTLVTIAKDVKIQVEFNPAAVRSYRLIGYENRMLAKEDFNDDTKDAGEIGAGHSVVALYEVVPANLPPGVDPRPAVDSLKYQAAAIAPAHLAEAAKSGETMTVKLRYKAPDGDQSKLIEMPVKDEGKTLTASSDEYKFSAAVAGFGLLLRDSAYKGTLSWETVRRLALDGKGADKLGYRGEFLQLIDKARGLKETRP